MKTLIIRSAFLAVSLPFVLLAEAVQEPAQDYGWDCPGSGYLPFRCNLLVSTEELARRIESSEVTVIHVGFDASGPGKVRRATYADGHIPGARHLSWSDLQGPTKTLRPAAGRRPALASLGILPDRRVVLYDTGLGLEAAAAFVALESVGLADRAALLDGQWVKWVCEGRPLCRWAEEGTPSEAEPSLSDVALSTAEVAALSRQAREPGANVTLLDGRAGESHAVPTPFLRMPWPEHLANLVLPILKGEEELRRQWRSVPARVDQQVVVSARHWTEAAPVYFVAKLLGYSVRLLDGSIEDLDGVPEALERGP